ncbi:MAG: hypothetical protein EOP06_11865 [Proteobacteria bacterium]|nr:MAG: hypothetical protein EOP06_11865 [Pseudomonadota bacterium]
MSPYYFMKRFYKDQNHCGQQNFNLFLSFRVLSALFCAWLTLTAQGGTAKLTLHGPPPARAMLLDFAVSVSEPPAVLAFDQTLTLETPGEYVIASSARISFGSGGGNYGEQSELDAHVELGSAPQSLAMNYCISYYLFNWLTPRSEDWSTDVYPAAKTFNLSVSDQGVSGILHGNLAVSHDDRSLHIITTYHADLSGRAGAVLDLGGGMQGAGFVITRPTSIRIRGRMQVGERGSSQNFPILPDRPPGGFTEVPSDRYLDPPMALGFDFTMQGPSLFTKIAAFPLGIDGDGMFKIWVDGQSLGTFSETQTVDFQSLLGRAVSAFRITGIDPAVESASPVAFPIKLSFNTPTASLTMSPVLAPSIDLAVQADRRISITFEGTLEYSDDLLKWYPMFAATSPYLYNPTAPQTQRFFRAFKSF